MQIERHRTGAKVIDGMLDLQPSLQQLSLKAHDRVGIEIRINYYQEQTVQEYMMPDILDINVRDQKGANKTVQVHIERLSTHKTFLGKVLPPQCS